MALLGPCGKLSALSAISINEVTTVGSIWPLASHISIPFNLAAGANDTTFLSDVGEINEVVNIQTGASPGAPGIDGYFTESNKLNSIANLLAGCVNSQAAWREMEQSVANYLPWRHR